MPEMTGLSMGPRKNRLASFSLIELLFVMAIISLLAALMLFAGSGAITKARRSRAASEIQAMGTGLEGYKTDNGIYPQSDGTLLLTNTAADPYYSKEYDGTTTAYQSNSFLLYTALSGQTNFTIAPVSGTKTYMSFKMTQVGNISPSTAYSYVKDPWGYSYGYSTGSTNNAPTASAPYNGSGFFDLWSTGGLLKASVNTNAWISNWQ